MTAGRASPADWTAAGLALLRDEGAGALTLERLCASLGKTKGSFYHHFPDLDAFLAALLARWERDLTDAPIRAAAAVDPARRAARLDAAVRALDHRLDLAVRAWAFRDARARAAVSRVDARRIAYLTALRRADGHRDARRIAELEYAAFLGAQQLGLLETPEAARMARLLARALAGLSPRRRPPARR